MTPSIWRLFVSLSAFVLLPISTAQACAFHMAEQDNLMSFQTANYQHTLALTIETNRALKNGLIEPLAKPLRGEAGFRQISWWLHLLAQELSLNELPTSQVVIIDVPLWSDYQQGRSRMAEIDTPMPSSSEPIIALTQATLYSLVSKK
ncbi:hypothetical protein KP803_14280 [Vibrio sp. ZSDE26]|uniref:Uncharacterized protein n=1 Tax=Vibrio amylolyticus TaxID=2847292 RepID=A0A9X1XNX8_9VIBR|nr:hypothetical protein [Vibrio amylolyticus]MCK6264445.1 hypothetical protein [Vibrio amylolyticus]